MAKILYAPRESSTTNAQRIADSGATQWINNHGHLQFRPNERGIMNVYSQNELPEKTYKPTMQKPTPLGMLVTALTLVLHPHTAQDPHIMQQPTAAVVRTQTTSLDDELDKAA